ncbi:hypothetical protein [Streptomyces lividans]|uniref:Uncharacterized protein n=1 Tax=Streptomyces lividans 1326 TaxID=1200984 RepID=A0A7U9HAM2_STRLI|nr:hypothetical protein SLI_2923 [Streptomyces lividans 1326]
MSGVRPGTAAPRGGTASRGGAGARGGTGARPGGARGANRAGGEERALTSVAAGGPLPRPRSPSTLRACGTSRSASPAPRAPLTEVRRALEQLAHDHPFLLTSRYADDHAEIRYWEEARDLHDAAAVALRLWGEHRQTAGLPPWEIVGLEVIDRATYHQRIAAGYGPAPATPVGVHPF